MQKLVAFLLVVAVAGFAAWWPASHRVVNTDRGVIVLHKRFLTYAEIYVDTRNFSSADFDKHPELKRAMIDEGYRDMLVDLKTGELKTEFDVAMDKAQAAANDIAAKIKQTVDIWLSESQDSSVTNQEVPAHDTNQPAAHAPSS